MSESILLKAEEIINGQRAKDYGDARENHQRIADLWNVYLQMEPDESIAPEDVAVMMILLKIARLMENGYHRDTVTDIAGYAGVLEKMQLPEAERYEEPQPRQWDSLNDVPTDCYHVISAGGCHWRFTFPSGGGSLWWYWNSEHARANGYGYDKTGPFTEVLEGSE